MEKTLHLILEKVSLLENGIKTLESAIHGVAKGQQNLAEGQTRLEERQDRTEGELKNLSRKLDAIVEQTAGLLEFRTAVIKKQEETDRILQRHDEDIALLKKVVIR
jgi:exonuclease VII small subunit